MAPSREMVRYTDASGRVMARIIQTVRLDGGVMKPAYVAEMADGSVQRERFKCAQNAIEAWAHGRGLRLSGKMV